MSHTMIAACFSGGAENKINISDVQGWLSHGSLGAVLVMMMAVLSRPLRVSGVIVEMFSCSKLKFSPIN